MQEHFRRLTESSGMDPAWLSDRLQKLQPTQAPEGMANTRARRGETTGRKLAARRLSDCSASEQQQHAHE
jgi:hypothetical protein